MVLSNTPLYVTEKDNFNFYRSYYLKVYFEKMRQWNGRTKQLKEK